MNGPVILDLCAGSGAWSEPYLQAGYHVIRVDLPQDVRLLMFDQKLAPMSQPAMFAHGVHGILAAPPCTCFSYARNRYPPSENELRGALSVVDACLRAVAVYRPSWWALENPLAKLRWFLGPPAFSFYQWEFGDPGHKPTALWGVFTAPTKRPRHRTKPTTWRTQYENARPDDAITPPGFARAFFEANP